MKNYRHKEKFNRDEQLQFILENRLNLQSTKRYLEGYKIPNPSFEYFKSKDFVNNYFKKWTLFQQKNFLIKLVGSSYWRKLQDILEKE